MKNAIEKATILSKALPYIQKYRNKVIVVKYGGNAMESEELKANVIKDIVLLSEIGIKVVLVHGGGPAIDQSLKAMNKKSTFIDGLRYTDAETIKVVQMVLAGQTNKDLVAMINSFGLKAVGISGMDAGLIQAKKYNHEKDLGFVGEIVKIDEKIIVDLLNNEYIPVIASVGIDEHNQPYNINADLAAASIASQLNAENMVLVSNIPGLLKDANDESSLLSVVYAHQVNTLKQQGIITKGMIPKVDCCINAIEHGVKKAVIIDGRVPHSLLIEILSDEGVGTMFMEEIHAKL